MCTRVCVCTYVHAERIKQTVSIDATTVDIEEKGVKLRLTVVDTPGFGDAVDNRQWYVYMIEIISTVLVGYLCRAGCTFVAHTKSLSSILYGDQV